MKFEYIVNGAVFHSRLRLYAIRCGQLETIDKTLCYGKILLSQDETRHLHVYETSCGFIVHLNNRATTDIPILCDYPSVVSHENTLKQIKALCLTQSDLLFPFHTFVKTYVDHAIDDIQMSDGTFLDFLL